MKEAMLLLERMMSLAKQELRTKSEYCEMLNRDEVMKVCGYNINDIIL